MLGVCGVEVQEMVPQFGEGHGVDQLLGHLVPREAHEELPHVRQLLLLRHSAREVPDMGG